MVSTNPLLVANAIEYILVLPFRPMFPKSRFMAGQEVFQRTMTESKRRRCLAYSLNPKEAVRLDDARMYGAKIRR